MTHRQKLLDELDVLLEDTGSIWKQLIHPTIRLLARGQPVTPAEITTESGVALPVVEQALADFGDVEWDEDGRVIGMGLTTRPTPHTMRIDGQQLYAWCAMDTLAFTIILDRQVTIESPDNATGEPITIEANGRGVISSQPTSAVVSWWVDASKAGVRESTCRHGHFFASAESARQWLAERPGGEILPLNEAFAVSERMVTEILSDGGR